MAKNVILMRHGAYDAHLNLSELGKNQVIKTAQALKLYLEGTVFVFTSPQARASQTAQQLCLSLEIPVYQEWELLDDNMTDNFRMYWHEVFPSEFTEQCKQCDTLILICHSTNMDWIPYQMNSLMGTSYRSLNPDLAEAFILDVVHRTVESVK